MLPINSRFRCHFQSTLTKVKKMVEDNVLIRVLYWTFDAVDDIEDNELLNQFRLHHERDERPARGLLHITREFLSHLLSLH